MANTGYSLGIYIGMICDLTSYVNYRPAVEAPTGEQLPGVIDIEFTDSSVVNLFKYKSGQDLTILSVSIPPRWTVSGPASAICS